MRSGVVGDRWPILGDSVPVVGFSVASAIGCHRSTRFVVKVDVTVESGERSADAVAHLADSHGQALVTFAYLVCGEREEARDIVQAVLVRLLGSASFAQAQAPLAYAKRAVTNEFIDRRRRLHRLARAMILLRGELPAEGAPEERHGERDALLRAFAVLNRRERAAVVLRYYEGWDDAAIAEAIHTAPATVRSLLSRAMPKLRAALTSPASESGEAT